MPCPCAICLAVVPLRRCGNVVTGERMLRHDIFICVILRDPFALIEGEWD
jgi:hypothetical protein